MDWRLSTPKVYASAAPRAAVHQPPLRWWLGALAQRNALPKSENALRGFTLPALSHRRSVCCAAPLHRQALAGTMGTRNFRNFAPLPPGPCPRKRGHCTIHRQPTSSRFLWRCARREVRLDSKTRISHRALRERPPLRGVACADSLCGSLSIQRDFPCACLTSLYCLLPSQRLPPSPVRRRLPCRPPRRRRPSPSKR